LLDLARNVLSLQVLWRPTILSRRAPLASDSFSSVSPLTLASGTA
jgi:hypothetical protein